MSRRISRRRFLSGGLSLAAGGALWLSQGRRAGAQVFNVQDFGAAGDGQQDDTGAIRAALAALPGVLVFPAGDYRLSGDLRPKSGSELQFQSGARLIQYGNAHILNLTGVSNVTISGAVLHHTGDVHPGGPSNLFINGSHHLEFHDIVNQRTDGFAFYIRPDSQYGECHDILIDGYTNTNRQYTTKNIDDGIDMIGYNITLRNFDIATNDDAISLKSYGGVGTHNVLIENGIIRSRDGGLTFGSEISDPGIRDVTVRNVSYDSVKVPVYFKGYNASVSGEVYDVHLQNITATGGAERFILFHTVEERTDEFHDITIDDCDFSGSVEFNAILVQRQRNIIMRNVTWNAGGSGKEGLYLQYGTHDSRFENFTFQNYGGSKPVKISGSGAVGNSFLGIPQESISAADGASLEAQVFSHGPFLAISEVSSIRWP